MLNPTTLPLPGKSDVEVTQVAIGRTNKTGVTSKGRLIVWEVSKLDKNLSASILRKHHSDKL